MLPADAVKFDESRKSGPTSYDRIESLLAVAEPLLGLDKSKGEKGYVRRQPGGTVFITASPYCSINYATGHPLEKQPRYNWVVSTDDNGIELGYLKDKPVKPETPASGDAVITAVALDGTAGMGAVGNVG